MNRVNNDRKKKKINKNRVQRNIEYDENDLDDISIKSSKKEIKVSGKKTKSKKEIKREKKQLKKEERKKKVKKFFLKLFLILLIFFIIIGILFYKKTMENGGGIKGALITVFGLSVEKVEALDTINILLLGISEDIDTKLTDTIILCSYNPKNQKASLISIPRDTFIGKNENTARGNDKINALYSKNPEKLLSTVSDITGIDVKYYAVVNTKTLIEIIDIIDGVRFDVPIDMNYDDPTQDLHIHLKKGMQKIDGEEAEQLLRFRHNNDGTSYSGNYGDNDFGRMKTQRNFITETIKQTISFKNIFKSKKIIDTVFENIETNFNFSDVTGYIPLATEFNFDNIENKQLPGESKKCNELWFFVYDKKETKEIIDDLEIIN